MALRALKCCHRAREPLADEFPVEDGSVVEDRKPATESAQRSVEWLLAQPGTRLAAAVAGLELPARAVHDQPADAVHLALEGVPARVGDRRAEDSSAVRRKELGNDVKHCPSSPSRPRSRSRASFEVPDRRPSNDGAS